MKMPKKPEMQMGSVKLPGFVEDLARDLRERRLLPLVVLLLIAIVTVPIALSDKSSPAEPTSPDSDEVGSASAMQASHLTVSPDAPGLRDYRRRLRDREASDPFSPPPSQASDSSSSSPSGEEAGGEAAAAETSAAPVEESDSASGGTEGVAHLETKYYTHVIDVRIVSLGSAAAGAVGPQSSRNGVDQPEPIVRRDQPVLSKLPGRNNPAVVFMGATSDGKKAVLLVSSRVSSVIGDGTCLLASAAGPCQLLALEPGSPETFVYGAKGQIFKIQLLKIHLVVSGRPR